MRFSLLRVDDDAGKIVANVFRDVYGSLRRENDTDATTAYYDVLEAKGLLAWSDRMWPIFVEQKPRFTKRSMLVVEPRLKRIAFGSTCFALNRPNRMLRPHW